MARSDVVKADLERIRGMSRKDFEDKWGDWARERDRDVTLVQQRWVRDLEHQLAHAKQEEALLDELTAAKAAHQENPTDASRQRRDAAVASIQAVRAAERANRTVSLAGDAYETGA